MMACLATTLHFGDGARGIRTASADRFLGEQLNTLLANGRDPVYDAAIAEPGVFSQMIARNFTPIDGTSIFRAQWLRTTPFQTTAEWAYGVGDWFEQRALLAEHDSVFRESAAGQWEMASSCESCLYVRMPTSFKFFTD